MLREVTRRAGAYFQLSLIPSTYTLDAMQDKWYTNHFGTSISLLSWWLVQFEKVASLDCCVLRERIIYDSLLPGHLRRSQQRYPGRCSDECVPNTSIVPEDGYSCAPRMRSETCSSGLGVEKKSRFINCNLCSVGSSRICRQT